MKDISKRVLEKIEKENLKPIPRWHFVLKSSFMWILFVVNLVLGVVGMAIIIYLFASNDAITDVSLVSNFWERIIFIVPIIWILLTALFVWIAYYNFKHTEGGYRFTAFKIFSLNILITLVLGFVVYISGSAGCINNLLSRHIPYYSSTLDTRTMVWMRPEEGYLAGDIQKVDIFQLELRDLNGDVWVVDFTGADVKPVVVLEEGERVKLIGEATTDSIFVASEIRPWGGMGRGMQEN